ncbi:hypothetical protein BDR04DRAFT_1112881 [Suillus decipiens]|nr:hypothetical protein BDR04DRAFT_1112881 [Suillus decipiens]
MAKSIQLAFAKLQEKMAAEAKCIPDDKLNLAVEKEEWCHRWSNLTLMSMEGEIEKCIKARQEKGVILVLTSEDVATGCQVSKWHNMFIGQLCALKEEAARQAKIWTQQSMGPDIVMGNQGDDEDGKDEIDPPEVHPKQICKSRAPVVQDADGDSDDGIVIHVMRCKCCESRDLECAGRESQGCTECRASKQRCSYSHQGVPCTRGKMSASTAAPICKLPVGPRGQAASSCRSEILDLLTDWDEAPSASQISKAKPVVMMPSRKHKLAEVKEEDFDLADSGLHGDDLMVAGRLRGVHAKFHTIQRLMAKVANELDMMCAHFNRKARG